MHAYDNSFIFLGILSGVLLSLSRDETVSDSSPACNAKTNKGSSFLICIVSPSQLMFSIEFFDLPISIEQDPCDFKRQYYWDIF